MLAQNGTNVHAKLPTLSVSRMEWSLLESRLVVLRGMGIRTVAFGATVACFGAPLGCGSEGDGVQGSAASGGTSADAAAGTNAGGTAAGRGGATGGVAGATDGSGGTVGSSGGGSTGTGAVSCIGDWGPAREVMAPPAAGAYALPTLSPDELEILYVRADSGGVSIHRSVRDSLTAMFPPGQRITELDAAIQRCNNSAASRLTGIDLSSDGLTVYIGCHSDAAKVGPLFAARRARIGAPFALDTQDYGPVGRAVAVSADELSAFSNGDFNPNGDRAPLMFTRSSTSAQFGSDVKIPGLEARELVALEPSPDGLWMFGSAGPHLAAARRDRPEATFGTLIVVVSGNPQSPQMGPSVGITDPHLSRDCRRLYYLHIVTQLSVQPVTSVRVIER